jgi:hypothetical protein
VEPTLIRGLAALVALIVLAVLARTRFSDPGMDDGDDSILD